MSKIKLTKGELKKQRDSLKQFLHYLPTLQLKKQQLQIKILEARHRLQEKERQLTEKEFLIYQWVGLLSDPLLKNCEVKIELKQWIQPKKILTAKLNIAGANIPVLEGVEFERIGYDFYSTPLWIDRGIVELREVVSILVEISVIKKQIEILQHELRITTQRVNLFEKIKIPECKENIRRIRIYLGDQMANAVGISKVAKGKIEAFST